MYPVMDTASRFRSDFDLQVADPPRKGIFYMGGNNMEALRWYIAGALWVCFYVTISCVLAAALKKANDL